VYKVLTDFNQLQAKLGVLPGQNPWEPPTIGFEKSASQCDLRALALRASVTSTDASNRPRAHRTAVDKAIRLVNLVGASQ
jgi:hypothetical protein